MTNVNLSLGKGGSSADDTVCKIAVANRSPLTRRGFLDNIFIERMWRWLKYECVLPWRYAQV